MAKHAKTKDYTREMHKPLSLFLIGFIFLLAIQLLVIASGNNIAAAPHDQLDSTVEYYLLGNLHAGEAFIPEIMGGLPASYAEGNMLASRILYAAFTPATAFAIQLTAVVLLGYIGIFLLLHTLSVRPVCCLLAGVLFGLLPFYSAYGLNVSGMPLVAYSILLIVKNPAGRNFALAAAICFLYASWSSITLGGYVVCFAVATTAIVFAAKGRSCYKAALHCSLLTAVLLVTYVTISPSIGERIVNTLTQTSSRAEHLATATPISLHDIVNFFLHGQYHANSTHVFFLPLCAFSIIVFLYCKQTSEQSAAAFPATATLNCKKLAKQVVFLMLFAAGIAIFHSLFWSNLGITLRNMLPGTLSSFQFDRLYWAYPTIWYVALGISCELLLQCRSNVLGIKRANFLLSPAATMLAFCIVVGGSTLLTAHYELSYSYNVDARTISANYIKHQQNNPDYLSWDRFYATDVFKIIENDLPSDKSTFRVASIGLYPNIALYHGYYTLDGYLPSYPLAYKHEFRKIITGELEASDELRTYFDEWGNRCYVFSHELGKNYLFHKTTSIELRDLRINIDQFKAMDGRFLFCGVPIAQPEQYGLKLVGAYSTENSYYCIWVYEA